MKVLIAGAGEVGFHLAKMLSYESHDITLIDTSKQALNYADTHLDILTIRGDATSPKTLNESNTSEADLVIAVTSSESINISMCVIAKQLGCKKTIARVSNSEFIEDSNTINFYELGIDEVISPEYLASREIQILVRSAFSDSFEFEKGALTMVGTTLEKGAPLIGKSMMEVSKEFSYLDFITIAIQRKDTLYTIIPRGDTVFEDCDLAYFIIPKAYTDDLYKLTTRENKRSIKRIMILGGGKIGSQTSLNLSSENFKVKLIEIDPKKAQTLAGKLSKTLIINGDGSNVELLEEEDLESMDAFIAVTGNSETNIISCLLAKNRGIKKTIALVENTEYFQISHSIGIDTLINKKILAASSIFRYVRRGNVAAITRLDNMDGEILEFIVSESSKIAGMYVKDLDFPRSAIIGGVIRDNKGIIAFGDFQIKASDKVVVCCMQETITKVERLFF